MATEVEQKQGLEVIIGAGAVGRAVMAELAARGTPVRIVNRRGLAEVGRRGWFPALAALCTPSFGTAAPTSQRRLI